MQTLYIFDADGTLVQSFTGNELLPRRAEMLRRIIDNGDLIAIATNQGGAACEAAGWSSERRKYPSVTDVRRRFREIAQNICDVTGLKSVEIAIAYAFFNKRTNEWMQANFKPCKEIYESSTPEWRKPSTGMLDYLAALHPYLKAVYVGDRGSDREAAENAGIEYYDAYEFFSGVIII